MGKNYIDKLAFIFINNRKLLMALSKGKDTWYIPGGKREKGESDIEALVREIKEELAVDLLAETIKYFGTFEAQAHGKAKGTKVRATCYTADFEGQFKPDSEIDQIDYFDYSKRDICAPAAKLILDYLKDKDLID